MPWQSQGGGGGPWGGGGGQGPWGGGNRGDGGQGTPPPDIEEMLRRSQDKVKRFLPSGGSKKGIALIAIVVLVGWLLTGFYRVDAGSQGVALIFGKLWDRTSPGLHYNIPSPIGQIFTPPVERVNRVEIGFRSSTGSRRSTARNVTQESLMLTGDENIIDTQFVVFWVIKDAYKYLFNVRNPELTVKAAAESAMREIIGKSDFESTRTTGRASVTAETQDLIQKILDDYGAGILIRQIEVQGIEPPEAVIDAFKDVAAAKQDAERAENEATAYRNEVTQRALGEAAQIVAAAEAYKAEEIAKANGETQRFLSVFEEYEKDKEVTRRRLYLQTMEEVLQPMEKVLIEESKGGSGVLPYLPLDQLKKGGTPTTNSNEGVER
ncbi:MAG: Modulator of FtsH protease HflK [Alphaproteobacteria bacterium MarineAlpha4_Bin2]|nr:MAG: Modulator of FtsH protease HflK [Alphaproteobacteria bacterium MarineAlpha4_Bin2]